MGNFLKKAFLNKDGEVSWQKVGGYMCAVGAILAVIPGAQAVGIPLGIAGVAVANTGIRNAADKKLQK